MTRTEIRITGFGGQGVILAAHILGRAAAVVDGGHATMNQSFGPEARGSACSAQLIICDEFVTYPYVRRTDILMAMSQDAYRQFVKEVKPGGIVVVDSSLVTPDPAYGLESWRAPATKIAEDLGRRIIANMAMIGLFTAVSKVVTVESARQAIKNSVPAGTEDINLAALEKGRELAKRLLEASTEVHA